MQGPPGLVAADPRCAAGDSCSGSYQGRFFGRGESPKSSIGQGNQHVPKPKAGFWWEKTLKKRALEGGRFSGGAPPGFWGASLICGRRF